MVRVANSYYDVAREIGDRMRDLPKAVRSETDTTLAVPVAYDVQVIPLVDESDIAAREREASLRTPTSRSACLSMYTHAQQSDDGVGLSFMTRNERALASLEWSRKLRERVRASDEIVRQRERNRVVVDLDWE